MSGRSSSCLRTENPLRSSYVLLACGPHMTAAPKNSTSPRPLSANERDKLSDFLLARSETLDDNELGQELLAECYPALAPHYDSWRMSKSAAGSSARSWRALADSSKSLSLPASMNHKSAVPSPEGRSAAYRCIAPQSRPYRPTPASRLALLADRPSPANVAAISAPRVLIR